MKNINRTNHFLLAQDDKPDSRGTSSLEMAALILSVACVVGLAVLLVQS
jgi:hypothetical protein